MTSQIEVALKAALVCLNTTPRFKITHEQFKDSYEVAAYLDSIMKFDLAYLLEDILPAEEDK